MNTKLSNEIMNFIKSIQDNYELSIIPYHMNLAVEYIESGKQGISNPFIEFARQLISDDFSGDYIISTTESAIEYLIRKMQSNNPSCPDCGCHTVKAGYQLKSSIQIYKCKNCGKRGTFTGKEGGRPKSLITQCTNCGNLNVYAKGMCEPCYRRDKRLKM